MAKRPKRLREICASPKNVHIDDACKAAEDLGFVASGGKGRHRAYSRKGEPTGLNFQVREGGKIPKYQADQLIEMIERYWPEDDGDE